MYVPLGSSGFAAPARAERIAAVEYAGPHLVPGAETVGAFGDWPPPVSPACNTGLLWMQADGLLSSQLSVAVTWIASPRLKVVPVPLRFTSSGPIGALPSDQPNG